MNYIFSINDFEIMIKAKRKKKLAELIWRDLLLFDNSSNT